MSAAWARAATEETQNNDVITARISDSFYVGNHIEILTQVLRWDPESGPEVAESHQLKMTIDLDRSIKNITNTKDTKVYISETEIDRFRNEFMQ